MSTALLMDGGMGSMLIAMGLETGTVPDAWNLSHPDAIRQVHRAYGRAGSCLVTTNTFGSNLIRLKANKLDGKVDDINRTAARLARDGAKNTLIAGDIGPTGLLLQPLGPLTRDDAADSYRRQAQALLAGGVDLFLLETFYCLEEALIAFDAVRVVSDLPIWASLTFRHTPRGFFTTHGDPPIPSLRKLLERGAAKVGSNCTLSSSGMVGLAAELVPEFGTAAFFQPNAGEPKIVDEHIVYPEEPGPFAADCAAIARLGAGAVGGCCGSTPEHIRELADALRGLD